MNNGTLTGFDYSQTSYNPQKMNGSWAGNRGRFSIDEIRMWGYPDSLRSDLSNLAGPTAGKLVQGNAQALSASVFYPGDAGSALNILSGNVVCSGGANGPFSAAYNTSGRVLINQSAAGNNSCFESNTIIANYGNNAVQLPTMTTCVGGNVYVTNGAACTIGTSIDYISNQAFGAVNGGTMAVSLSYNYQAKSTVIRAGVTVTKRVAFRVEDAGPSIGGTLTTQTGLEIPAMVSGTTNIGINNQSALLQQGAFVATNNTVTVTSNAGTVATTAYLSTFTNSSAAAMTITLSTSSPSDGQKLIVRVYDFSAVSQTITWVHTTNSSSVAVPASSNGSTTLPLTVGFIYSSAASSWICVAVA